MFLIEAGASTTVPCYSKTVKVDGRRPPEINYTCDGNPIDFLCLSIFTGKLPPSAQSSIGSPFLNVDWLQS